MNRKKRHFKNCTKSPRFEPLPLPIRRMYNRKKSFTLFICRETWRVRNVLVYFISYGHHLPFLFHLLSLSHFFSIPFSLSRFLSLSHFLYLIFSLSNFLSIPFSIYPIFSCNIIFTMLFLSHSLSPISAFCPILFEYPIFSIPFPFSIPLPLTFPVCIRYVKDTEFWLCLTLCLIFFVLFVPLPPSYDVLCFLYPTFLWRHRKWD